MTTREELATAGHTIRLLITELEQMNQDCRDLIGEDFTVTAPHLIETLETVYKLLEAMQERSHDY